MRLEDYINNAEPVKGLIQLSADDLDRMIKDSIPDSISKSVVVSTNVEFRNGSADISVNISGSLYRASLQPDRYGGVDNIVSLFSKGWSYASWKAPSGYWHGSFVYARHQKESDPFIAKAVALWKNKWDGRYGSNAKINSTYVNPKYT